MSAVEIVAEGLQFPEGPVWMQDGSVIVVEIAAGRITRVLPSPRFNVTSQASPTRWPETSSVLVQKFSSIAST